MSREVQVRFCERRGVRFPPPTLPFVNDARREFWGKDAIRAWLDREVIGDRVTMDVTATAEHFGDVAVYAAMDGNYDKTGLPDPLILAHYPTIRDDRIARLIIIRNDRSEGRRAGQWS